MSLKIGELVGYLRLENEDWVAKHRKAKQDLQELSDDWSKVGGRADAAAGSFISAVMTVGKIAPAAAGLASVGSTLVTMSGALGLIPAAGVGALIAISALKLGLQGFGDALKETDPAKFNEAVAGLAPEARETAVAVRDMRGAWSDMQKSVQDELFTNLGGHVRELGGTYIPVLQRNLRLMGADFNLAAQQTGNWLAEGKQVSTVNSIFANTRGLTNSLAEAAQPFLAILLDIVAVGTEFFPKMNGELGKTVKGWADAVHAARESGQLKQWMAGGLSALGDMFKLLKNIGSIVGTVFGAFQSEGAGLLPTLIKITDKVKEFLQSAQGQEMLHSLAAVLRQVADVAAGVLFEALTQLAPIIVKLAPGFGDLAVQVGGVLVTALRIVGPLLQGLAGFLSANIDWLGPLAIALFTGAKAMEYVTAGLRILNMVAGANPWVIIIAATIALVTFIITHWDQIIAWLGKAWEWIKNTARTAWEHIKSAIVDPITKAAAWVGERIEDVKKFFTELPGKILAALVGLAEIIKRPFVEAFDWVRTEAAKIGSWIKDSLDFTGINNAPRDLLARAQASVAARTGGGGSTAGRAIGGSVTPWRTYEVGERGRELFRPETPGVIVPNHELGRGGTTVEIGNYYPPANADAHDVAAELDWFARSGGR